MGGWRTSSLCVVILSCVFVPPPLWAPSGGSIVVVTAQYTECVTKLLDYIISVDNVGRILAYCPLEPQLTGSPIPTTLRIKVNGGLCPCAKRLVEDTLEMTSPINFKRMCSWKGDGDLSEIKKSFCYQMFTSSMWDTYTISALGFSIPFNLKNELERDCKGSSAAAYCGLDDCSLAYDKMVSANNFSPWPAKCGTAPLANFCKPAGAGQIERIHEMQKCIIKEWSQCASLGALHRMCFVFSVMEQVTKDACTDTCPYWLITPTPTVTPSPSNTVTYAASVTPIPTPTATLKHTPSPSGSPTPTQTLTPNPSGTPSPSASRSGSVSASASSSSSRTSSPTATPSLTRTNTHTGTVTASGNIQVLDANRQNLSWLIVAVAAILSALVCITLIVAAVLIRRCLSAKEVVLAQPIKKAPKGLFDTEVQLSEWVLAAPVSAPSLSPRSLVPHVGSVYQYHPRQAPLPRGPLP